MDDHLKRLQGQLRRWYAQYAELPERTDKAKRLAMVQVLGAVAMYLRAQPGSRPEDTALLSKLNRALFDTERGVSISYLSNRKNRRGPVPHTTRKRVMRERVVEEVARLVVGGYYEPKQAASSVARKRKVPGGEEAVLKWFYKSRQVQKAAKKRKPK